MTSSGGTTRKPATCPKCGGDGHVLIDGRLAPCECLRPEILSRALKAAHIPPAYRHATIDTFEAGTPSTQAALRMVRERIADYGPGSQRGVMLIGPNGVGKTHLAIGILRALVERGYSGAFYNVIDLLDEFKAQYGRGESESRVDSDLTRDVLVLDDLGVQRATGWSAERLHAVINRRYELGRTLIVTTNRTVNELRKVLDNAIVSRLYEMCAIVMIDGEDRRSVFARQTKSQERTARTRGRETNGGTLDRS